MLPALFRPEILLSAQPSLGSLPRIKGQTPYVPFSTIEISNGLATSFRTPKKKPCQ
jgi:hypothetical protein